MSQNLRILINLEARNNTNLSGFVISVVELGIHRPNCFKLQALKQASKQKVSVPKVQDPMTLIHELVKVLNLYANTGVEIKANSNRNCNSKFASKRVLMQKTQSQ